MPPKSESMSNNLLELVNRKKKYRSVQEGRGEAVGAEPEPVEAPTKQLFRYQSITFR